MKYQIIRTQVSEKESCYTVHLVDDSESTEPSIQLCRLNNNTRHIRYVSYEHNMSHLTNCEYCWYTQEEAEQFIREHKDHLENWDASPKNPKNWEKPKVIKEFPA